jgi:hypothetical protein
MPLRALQEFKNIVDTTWIQCMKYQRIFLNIGSSFSIKEDTDNVDDAGREDLLTLLGKFSSYFTISRPPVFVTHVMSTKIGFQTKRPWRSLGTTHCPVPLGFRTHTFVFSTVMFAANDTTTGALCRVFGLQSHDHYIIKRMVVGQPDGRTARQSDRTF